jgi:hypothetical protein
VKAWATPSVEKGGSTTGLSATDAWHRTAVGDDGKFTPHLFYVSVIYRTQFGEKPATARIAGLGGKRRLILLPARIVTILSHLPEGAPVIRFFSWPSAARAASPR